MSTSRLVDGVVARHRERLPRLRKSLRLEIRVAVYEKLIRLAGDGSVVAAVERLVEQAPLPSESR